MKRHILLFAILYSAVFTSAQITKVATDLHGSIEITIEIADAGYIVMDIHGYMIDFELFGDLKFYSDLDFNEDAIGKIKQAGYANFSYYPNTNSYEAGKIKQIGDLVFKYYTNSTKHQAGKLKQVGDVSLSYYPNRNDYEAGKIKQIGNTVFSYYPNTNYHEAGKIKQIGNKSYSYYTDEEYKGTKRTGQMKAGWNQFDEEGITYMVIL